MTGAFTWGAWILGATVLLAACGKTDIYLGSPSGGSGDADSDADGDVDSDSDSDSDAIVCDKGIYFGGHHPISVTSVHELQSLAGYTGVSGYLRIQACPDCVDLDPLVCLRWVTAGLTIGTNGSLADLTGLSSLELIGGSLDIRNDDALVTLDGLDALTYVGRFVNIGGNDNLVSVDGLAGLGTVVLGIDIMDNPALTDLDGLDGITSLERLRITGNATLTNLDGLSGLTYIGEGTSASKGLDVRGNPALPDCEICDLLEQLTTGDVMVDVGDNLDDTCTPVPDGCP